MREFEAAWQILEQAVFSLNPEDLRRTITIRGIELTVEEALARKRCTSELPYWTDNVYCKNISAERNGII